MILAYHRPKSLKQALALLARPEPLTLPLGGGRILSRPDGLRATPLLPQEQPFEVVDLQDLQLDRIQPAARSLGVGAAVRLKDLADALDLASANPAAAGLARAVRSEFNPNLAASATAAGALVSATGLSLYAAAVLALEATCETASAENRQTISASDLLALRKDFLRGRLITTVNIPLTPSLDFETIARSPADRPLVFAAVARWGSGRTRVVVGGWGAAPVLALDGPDAGGAAFVAAQACSQSGDAWASAQYRAEMAAVLVERCLTRLGVQA